MAMTQTVHADEDDKHRAGQLHKLRLENFMCHENFEMTFGAHVNFISGTNGSGKSAVLQGIQACLGVRASDTGRSSSLSSFVKEGANYALIAVTVFNTGEDAYQPEIYGDFITVERRIGPQSGFVLKNASGRKVASGRNALTAMLDALNLNASNPVAVLTQDTARTFLAGAASDKRKYDLFMEASLLEEISENYNASAEAIEAQKSTLVAKKQELEASKEKLEELRQKVKDLQRVKDKKEDSEMLTKALAWTRVYEHDPYLEKVRIRLEVQGPEKLEALDTQCMQADADAKVLSEELQKQKASINDLSSEIQRLLHEATRLQNEHKKTKAKFLEASKRVEHVQRDLAEAYQKRNDIASSAAEEHQELINSTQAALAEYKETLNSLDQQSQALDTQEYEANATVNEQHAVLQGIAKDEEDLKLTLRAIRKTISDGEGELKGFRSTTADDVLRFFRNDQREQIKKLLSAISGQATLFHYPPVGPIGQHLAISDERWAVAVQAAIGPLFGKFIVHNNHDADVLRRLAGKSGIDLRYFSFAVRRFDLPLHQIPDRQRPQGVTTLLDILACKSVEVEAIVLNYLIDQGGIERIALASSKEEGTGLAYGPRYREIISRVYLADGSFLYQKGRSQTFVGGGRGLRPTLSVDVASQVAGIRQYIAEQGQLLRQTQQQFEQVVARKREAEGVLRKAKSKCQGIRRQRLALESQRNTANSQRPEDLMPQEDAATLVAAQLEEVDNEIVHLEQKLNDKKKMKREAKTVEEAALSAVKSKKVESDQLKTRNEERSAELNDKAEGVRIARENAEQLRKKKAVLEKKLEQLEIQKAQAESQRRQALETAKEVCTEAEGNGSLDYVNDLFRRELGQDAADEDVAACMEADRLEDELKKVLKEVHRQEGRAGGTLDELEPRLEAEEKKQRTKKRRYEQFCDPVRMLANGLDTRRKRLKDMGRRIESQVQTRFKHYMSQKGNVGTIRLNRNEGKLVMSVTMSNSKNEKNSGAVEDLKSLSGGEKSFTTVSFILALGEITENPFRAMDEFDVYMDAVNRRISMQSLIKFAFQLSHVQFLFLTPQDISAVEDAKRACQKEGEIELSDSFIKVVRMQPARENAIRS
uniref:RecF/RecN/SMC N-terminal domain-containing protein n=1 Tax=Tetraselmis chuii TaxID=63592 RepID=A0A7S1SHS8_9CHLO|mmetsp:Transcript_1250/g.2210  ORF Transcript_1250/g.2210 Transcript_1250/m.2210 type:complete len:1106 (+) Transcript_1250:351-3668(+)